MNDDNNNFRILKPKPRSKKLRPKIDLAAMVSVSFLLIIFFMVTRELSMPKAMELGLPERCGEGGCYGGCGTDFNRKVTLLLDDNDKVIMYWGLLEVPNEPIKKLNYGKNGIRKELSRISEKVNKISGCRDKGAIVLIKPSKKSNYGNLVDILDEMKIVKIPTYVIINDFTPDEYKLLASK
jgi:biopolymer transport protein ExbD